MARKSDVWKAKHTVDLGVIDPIDNPETLYMEEVRTEVDYDNGWRRAVPAPEIRAA